MFFIDLLIAFAIALGITAVLSGPVRTPAPWASFGLFFLVLFLATWASGLWIVPFGPVLWGVAWLPFFVAGFVIALLIVAAADLPPERLTPGRSMSEQRVERADPTRATAGVTTTLVWALLVVLILPILFGYAT